MAETKLQLFKPSDIVIDIGGKKEKIKFDMNAVLELEAIYGSIDYVFKMLFSATNETHVVKVDGEEIDITKVTVDDAPLVQLLQKQDAADRAIKTTIKDTVALLWVGLLHEHAKRDEDGEIVSCDITKGMLRESISFKNQLAEVNTKIVSALIRDLIAPDNADNQGEIKN